MDTVSKENHRVIQLDPEYIFISCILFVIFLFHSIQILRKYCSVFSKYSFIIILILNFGFGGRAIMILVYRYIVIGDDEYNVDFEKKESDKVTHNI